MTVKLPENLPESLEDCHGYIEECHALIATLSNDNQSLQARVDFLLKQLFGKKSERIDPNQLALFESAEEQAPAQAESDAQPEMETVTRPKRKGHGRKPLPKDLPRERVVHDLTPEEKLCPECGTERKPFGEDISEQLDYVPASIKVIEHVRPKYSCPCCQEHVAQAQKPAQPIEKGLAAPGLIAHVIVSKYCDHLPLHRQEKIFKRHGVELSRKTLCGWMLQAAALLSPVVFAMQERVLQSRVIHTDDTPVRVQDKQKNRTTRKAYLWPYVGDAHNPYIVFDYTPTRCKDGPESFLEKFTGTQEKPRYLQCDAYPGYNGLFTADRHLLEVACWAHARRKFHDAKTSDPACANLALLKIGKLYELERLAREQDLDAAALLAMRHEQARPLLDELKVWLLETQAAVLPKSPMGEACAYALGNWDALRRYTDAPFLNIDNNAAERAVRGIALGRKNWLFLGSDAGGTAAAIHFSLIASAQRHDLDPFAYLRSLLAHIPTWPNRDIEQLLPDQWASTFGQDQ